MDARVALLALGLGYCAGPALAQFDHSHAAWDALLRKNVVVEIHGTASRVRYMELNRQRLALREYLDSLSRVTEPEFNAWSKAQRMAFLINAYNAFTVEKVLTKYPDIRSIWDFGKLFGDPFKDKFFALLGRPCSLDTIEHDMLRKPGTYDEPRIHFAVNCASVGCPMLREEAYVAERLESQLEAQVRRFFSDHTRNRYNPRTARLEVSKIFDWFKDDFHPRERFFARYAEFLGQDHGQRQLILEGRAPLAFVEYDWSLNDSR